MTNTNTAAMAADLAKLAAIPDNVIRAAARKAWIKEMADRFQVQAAFAEHRLAGIGPYLPAAPVAENEGGV